MLAAIQRPALVPNRKANPYKTIEVAVVTHFFASHGGGIELVAERLIRELAMDGQFRFSWISSDCDPAPDIPNQVSMPMRTCNGFEKLLGFPWPLWGPGSLARMRHTVRNADIVWLHDTLYPGNILAFLTARKAGKPIVITQHIAPIPYRNPLMRWLMRVADRAISSRLLANASEVIFISDRVADDYYARVPFTKPIKVVPNGVDTRIFYPAMMENRRFLRQQFALKNGQPVLLFVGRFTEKKGMDVIRRLAQSLPEWRFWLAGSGRIDPNKWLLPNVHVHKNRKGQSLAELYQAADLLIMPSYGEGFPLVIQEAMACGLPVLCSPSTAQGHAPAMDRLYLADVFPDSPARTAEIWLEKLKKFPRPLPLIRPQEDLAEFALHAWDWTAISQVYTDILKNLNRQTICGN